jgi:EAL domain-containing protein (putative c-di-GMP-specific phosphodiesterase class I)
VIAEGIETEGQRRFLERERCDEGQGYLFGRAVPPDEFLWFVKRSGSRSSE